MLPGACMGRLFAGDEPVKEGWAWGFWKRGHQLTVDGNDRGIDGKPCRKIRRGLELVEGNIVGFEWFACGISERDFDLGGTNRTRFRKGDEGADDQQGVGTLDGAISLSDDDGEDARMAFLEVRNGEMKGGSTEERWVVAERKAVEIPLVSEIATTNGTDREGGVSAGQGGVAERLGHDTMAIGLEERGILTTRGNSNDLADG